jgi:triosephosphate isomerase
MSSRTPLIAGNWKMHLNHLEAIALVQRLAFTFNDADYDSVDVVVLPPFTDIRSVQTLIDADGYRIRYGAQDISSHDSGAYTGEVSGGMLAKLGCGFALVGHSERRALHGETDELVAAKLRACLRFAIDPILCVGEDLEVRRSGDHVARVLAQLSGALTGLTDAEAGRVAIAYEPVWAIGTGEVATPADAQEVCSAVRAWLKAEFGSATAAAARILYGGSVKAANIAGIMAEADVDGALVGGASLDADEFVGIVRYRLHP